MPVHVTLPLFAGPGHELEEGARVTGRQLRDLAGNLHERLLAAAEVVDQLAGAGWSSRVALYDVLLQHDGVETRDEAVRLLREAGVDPEKLMIVEEVEDEEIGMA
jgi:hypothetical protein